MKKSETFFRDVFDALFQFNAVLSAGGVLLHVNRPALSFIRAAREDVVGKFIWDTPWWAHSNELREKLKVSIARAARGALIRYHATHRNWAGEEAIIDFSVKRIVDDSGATAMLVVEGRDITERRRLEHALFLRQAELRRQIAFHRTLLDAIAHSGLNWIMLDGEKIVHASKAVSESFDYSEEELKALPNFNTIIHPDDRERVNEHIRRRMAGEPVPKRYDIGLLLKDGGRREYEMTSALVPDTTPKRALVIAMDITERKRIEEELRTIADYARNLIESSLDPMLVIDMHGRISDVNQATEEITGKARSVLAGSDFAACFTQAEEAHAILRRVYREGRVRDCPLLVRHATGKTTEVMCNLTHYRNAAGEVQGVFAVARDMTDIRQYESMLSFQATRDALTALPNRSLFREHLARAIGRASQKDRAVVVMFIDLDNFKDVNETLGHAVGDELLKATASRIVDNLPESATVSRFGGDEFAVLIEDPAKASLVWQLAAMLLEVVREAHTIDGNEVVITCSIGITLFPDDTADPDAMLRNADTAMYRAKEGGKNKIRYFTAEMNDAVQRRVEIGKHLRHALKAEEFTLHYQPRVELGAGSIVGAEALIRWNSAVIGAVSPVEFIPIAENNGLIVPIGEWVLHTACHQARQWLDGKSKPISVAVNLSARQFHEVDIVRQVVRALDESGLPPHLLELELTESMLMHDVKRVLHTLAALKEIGVSLAVDDFGTGYSSLSYLKRFPLDYLKVDRSFIKDMPGDQNDAAIVRAIVAMAHGIGVKVIAEGVETVEQLAFLLDQGCDEMQGYYFSKPLTADAMIDLLKEPRVLDLRTRESSL